MLEGHDCGILIPQATTAQPNVLTPVLMLKSKRAVTVSAATVKMNGLATACTASVPPIPLLTCGDPVSLPGTLTFTNGMRGVLVGATGADIAGGLLNTGVSMGLDYLLSGMSDGLLKDNLKNALSCLAGLGVSALQHELDPRYPYKLSLGIKLPANLEAKTTVQWGSSDENHFPSKVTFGLEYKLDGKANVDTVDDQGNATTKETGVGTGAKVGVSGEYVFGAGDKKPGAFKIGVTESGAVPFVGGVSESHSYGHDPNAPEGEKNTVTATPSATFPWGPPL